jgi:hypothetical protein
MTMSLQELLCNRFFSYRGIHLLKRIMNSFAPPA